MRNYFLLNFSWEEKLVCTSPILGSSGWIKGTARMFMFSVFCMWCEVGSLYIQWSAVKCLELERVSFVLTTAHGQLPEFLVH